MRFTRLVLDHRPVLMSLAMHMAAGCFLFVVVVRVIGCSVLVLRWIVLRVVALGRRLGPVIRVVHLHLLDVDVEIRKEILLEVVTGRLSPGHELVGKPADVPDHQRDRPPGGDPQWVGRERVLVQHDLDTQRLLFLGSGFNRCRPFISRECQHDQ